MSAFSVSLLAVHKMVAKMKLLCYFFLVPPYRGNCSKGGQGMHLKIDPGTGSESQVKKPKSSRRRLLRQELRQQSEWERAQFMRSSSNEPPPDLSGYYLGPVLS